MSLPTFWSKAVRSKVATLRFRFHLLWPCWWIPAAVVFLLLHAVDGSFLVFSAGLDT